MKFRIRILHKYILLIIAVLSFSTAFSGVLKGVIKNQNGELLPFASVYVKNTTYGTSSNLKGAYFLDLKEGAYTVVFSFSGHKSQEQEVHVSDKGQTILDVVLNEEELNTLIVYSDNKDRAKEIIKEVRKKRKYYLNQVSNYTCKTYQKTSLDKKVSIDLPTDSVLEVESGTEGFDEFIKRINLNLIESISTTSYRKPNKYKEHYTAYKNYSETGESSGMSISFEVGYGEEDFAPVEAEVTNPYILYEDIHSSSLNFYKNLIDFPGVTLQPILSPIADNGGMSYKYVLDGSFYENGKLIYKLKVTPIFETDPAFMGVIFIEDSTWKLVSLDLKVNPKALSFCEEFSIIQNYSEVQKDVLLPTRKELNYTIKEGRNYIIGNTKISITDYIINALEPEKWGSEIKTFDVYAMDRDSSFWEQNRRFELQEKELHFIHVCDTLYEYFNSESYLTMADSTFNRFGWRILMTGFRHRNSFKKTEWLMQARPNPFGIGGYRHKSIGVYKKEWQNGVKLENDGFFDYGVNTQDFKGKLSVGLTYIPKKFVRTKITFGDYFSQINNYASFSQVFSGSNYVRKKEYGIAHRMEVFNGLYAEAGFSLTDQLPLENITFSKWRELLFGELNEVVDFERYTKSELTLDLKYRMKQKYMIKGNKKLILESKGPVLTMKYKRGIPGLFNSEVDYNYIEFGAKQSMKLKRFGLFSWGAKMGTYLSKNNLRVLEHKYFRGSDPFFFSNPVGSFQLLGPSLATENAFFSVNVMHHFEGSIMNKIPLVNRLKLQLAGGAGTLLIEDDNFKHAEVFVGLERVFRIRKELFRIGGYFVTADNNLEKADYSFKIGVSFYDPFFKKWDY